MIPESGKALFHGNVVHPTPSRATAGLIECSNCGKFFDLETVKLQFIQCCMECSDRACSYEVRKNAKAVQSPEPEPQEDDHLFAFELPDAYYWKGFADGLKEGRIQSERNAP